MKESGQIDRIWGKYKLSPATVLRGTWGNMVILLESVQDCLGHGTQALTIYNVLGIFFFLWGGAGLAIVTVFAEYIFKVILTFLDISLITLFTENLGVIL